jgi:hypothetical protein
LRAPVTKRLAFTIEITAASSAEKQLIGFALELFNRDLSTRLRLQMCVELVVLSHAGLAGHAGRNSGTEFLKVNAYPIEGEAASTMGTLNSRQRYPQLSFCETL